jgi:CubicO group peptidase (beta-lactamase class C family)
MRRLFLQALLCIALLCGTVKKIDAQNLKPQIENYFNEIGKFYQLNGNILLAIKGQVIVNMSFGYADFGVQKTNTTDIHYNLCSISKIFTSTAILQLRDKGKLSLNDNVVKYLTDIPFPDITIKQLLTHTSGLPDLELFEHLVKQYPDTVITSVNVIPELKKWEKGLYFKPGDRHQYNNVGYILLAIVVEKIAQQSFATYLQQHIFKPAGMNNTYLSVYPKSYYGNDNTCAKMHFQSHPYYDTTYSYADASSQYKYTNYNFSGNMGCGNIITTTNDLLKFDQTFFAFRLLKPSTMEEAFTPLKLNSGETYYGPMDTYLGEGKMSYGLGWNIWEQPNYGKSVGHGGFIFGNATFYAHNLENKQTIIAFDNTAGSEFGRIVTSANSLLNQKEPMEIRCKRSLAFVYGSALVKQGVDGAACNFNSVKSDTTHYYLSEWEFNQLGGNLLYRSSFDGHESLALDVFKINTFLFPASFNTYDSYAEGLRVIGKKQESIIMYQKSISLNPNNEEGKKNLEELLKK